MIHATCPYTILGLKLGASVEEVRKAHRSLALKWHPDKVADVNDEVAVKVATQQFQLIQAAYEALSEPKWQRQCGQSQTKAAPGSTFTTTATEPPRKRPCRPASAHPAPRPASMSTGWMHGQKATLRVPADAPTVGAAVDLLPVCGGTIFIEPGEYNGIVVIAKPFVKIMGVAGSSQMKVVVKGQVIFRECAMGAKLQGFTIAAACTGGAVDLKGVKGNVTIEDCEITNETSAGIIFEGCSGDTTIHRCLVHHCKYDGLGLHLMEGKETHQGSVMITNSGFESNGYDGLYLADPRFWVTLLHCNIVKNRRHGIFVRGTKFDMQESTVIENGQEAVHREKFEQKQCTFGGKPASMQKEQTPREVTRSALPADWRIFQTAEGLQYYYHCKTGIAQWSPPVCA